jgi:hypothetical protein
MLWMVRNGLCFTIQGVLIELSSVEGMNATMLCDLMSFDSRVCVCVCVVCVLIEFISVPDRAAVLKVSKCYNIIDSCYVIYVPHRPFLLYLCYACIDSPSVGGLEGVSFNS